MDLLRALALAFPERYPDLHVLTDKDAELDFFNNVAHLQLHRRSRAFKRLANVSLPSSCTESADSLWTVILAILPSLSFPQHSRIQNQACASASHKKHFCRGQAICPYLSYCAHCGWHLPHGFSMLHAVQACQSGVMSGTTLMGVAAPLLQQVVIEGGRCKDQHDTSDCTMW